MPGSPYFGRLGKSPARCLRMTDEGKPDEGERVSLAPLDPETALRALLRVKPTDAPAEEDKAERRPGEE